jgi:hypothetical protein
MLHEKPHDEHDRGDSEDRVDQPSANMADETEQPQKNQNGADLPPHDVSSCVLSITPLLVNNNR